MASLRGLFDILRFDPIGTAGRKSGIGYPNPGWAPPSGWATASSTGITVNQDQANTVAAWYAGVRVISEDVASLPLILYRRGTTNVTGTTRPSRDRAYDDDLYRVLHDQFNPEMTSYVGRETMTSHAVAWGNAYAEKELSGTGRTLALWPLRPDRMDPRWEGGQRVYYYTVQAGTAPVRLTSDRVFHMPGLGFDGLKGYSVLSMARETLGSAIALREYGNRVLANDARPSVVLKHPATLSDKARDNLRTSWEASHGGFTNAGRMALLEEGMDLKDFGFPPEDIQFLESQKWQVTEIARWLRLAPHKIGDLERATFSNIEEQNIDHVTSTIRPWCIRWEQQLNKDVVQRPDMFAEHLLDALLRGKTLERAQAWVQKIGIGAAVPNEWRDSDNENPLAWGDERVSTPNNTAAPPPPEPTKSGDHIFNIAGTTVEPAQVNVTTPDVKVDAPVTVNMPEQQPTVVNVAPAEVKVDAPVTVNVPEPVPAPTKRTRKVVERDDAGRITAVTEDA